MAQLKDTLIQGSARVTDTLYTTNIAGGTVTAPIYWTGGNVALPEKTSAEYFLAIDAFASGGKTYWVSKANVLSSIGAATSGHNHDTTYLKLSGGKMTGRIYREGVSSSWHKGRDNSLVAISTKSGYSPLASMKTTNGSWEIGTYDNTDFTDDLLFSYIKDTTYSGTTAKTDAQIRFYENGGALFVGQTTITYNPGATDSTAKGMINLTSSAPATVAKSGSYSWGINHLVPNLASGGHTCLITGMGNGTNNSAALEFNYVGSNHADNSVGLGLYGNNQLLTINKAGTVKIKATTASTSSTTGALVVGGGIGTGAASYLTGSVHIIGSAGSNALLVRGISGCGSDGIRGDTVDEANQGIYLNINGGPVIFGYGNNAANNYVNVQYTQDATSISTGAFRVSGGVSITKGLWVGGTITGALTGHASSDLALTGGTMTGALNLANNTWNKIGDDAYLGDINKSGHIGIQGVNGNTGIFFTTYNQTTKLTGGAITWDGTRFNIANTINSPTITDGTGVTAADLGASVNPRYRPASWKYNAGIVPIDGDIVTVKIPSAAHDYGTWLSLDNGATYHPIIHSNGSRLQNWFSNNMSITLRYDAAATCSVFGTTAGAASNARATITGCWRLITQYDTGNPGDWNLRQYTIKAANAITAVHIIGGTDSGYSNIDSGTAFDIRYAVLYAGSNIAKDATGNNNYVHHYSINIKNSSNGNISLTTYSNVYIKGTISGTLFTPVSGGSPYVSDTGLVEGYAYYYIGRCYANNNAFTFDATGRSIYWYIGGSLVPYTGLSNVSNNTALNSATGSIGDIIYWSAANTPAHLAKGAAGQFLKMGSANVPVWGDGSSVTLNGTATTSANFYAPTTAGASGQFLQSSGEGAPTWATITVADEKVKVAARGTTKAYLLASTSATSNGTTAVAETDVYLGTTAGHLYATAVHNAVWNDYAEYRKQLYTIAPGYAIQDTDNGYILQTEKRLIPGAQIVSDTWGHIMGETEGAKTPVAVAGRVLAYTYRPREEYHAGMAVCSAPGGTIDIMTREEIRNYPDAIIGIVSEIPDYEEWGSGNVKVDGRIWIKVR